MKRRDTDYLYSTTRIRAMEKNLLNAERIGRMLDAKSFEDTVRIPAEMGYGEITEPSQKSIEHALAKERDDTIKTILSFVDECGIVDIIRLKYDYHNIKTLIKAEHMPEEADILSGAGHIPVDVIKTSMRESDFRDFDPIMRGGIIEAREVLSRTNDPQLSDFVLDRAYFAELLKSAGETKSGFIGGYVRLLIDVYNLRAWVRATRQKKNIEFIKNALISGGDTDVSRLLSAGAERGGINEIYSGTKLAEAAAAGERAASGETGFLDFERLCDNALIEYIKSAKYVAFGEAPIAAYLIAKEADITNIRIILAGKLEGLSADEIRARLRGQYV